MTTRARSGPGSLLAGLAVLLAGVLLYVPSFAAEELDDEEGRRAIPAREMLESGDFVLPTIWGRPYLNKPPMYFWLVAGAATLTGGVDEAATRLPSVVATILTALAVLAVGRRIAGPRTALIAALLFLVTLGVFEKGAFGELEAVLTATTFVACASQWLASRGGPRAWAWSVVAGLALGAALLTKGPPVFVFWIATLLAIAVDARSPRALADVRSWAGFLLGSAIAGAWALLLLRRPELQGVVENWGSEMARGGTTPGEWLAARADLAVGVLVAFFPASFVLLATLGTRTRRALRRESAYRVPALVVAIGLVAFALLPGAEVRYVHPLLPWAALAAGGLVARLADSEDRSLEARARALGRLVALLGLASTLGAVWLAVGSIGDLEGLGAVGIVAALATAVASWAAWHAWRAPASARALWLTFAVLACARLLQLGELVPRTAGHRGRVVAARALETRAPANEPLHLAARHHYNTLFYVRRTLRFVERPEEAPVGVPVVFDVAQLRRLREERGREAETLIEVETHEGSTLCVARLAPPPTGGP